MFEFTWRAGAVTLGLSLLFGGCASDSSSSCTECMKINNKTSGETVTLEEESANNNAGFDPFLAAFNDTGDGEFLIFAAEDITNDGASDAIFGVLYMVGLPEGTDSPDTFSGGDAYLRRSENFDTATGGSAETSCYGGTDDIVVKLTKAGNVGETYKGKFEGTLSDCGGGGGSDIEVSGSFDVEREEDDF